MNAKLRTEAKIGFQKKKFKLMNNAVLGKTMKNVRKRRGMKLVTADKIKIQLVLEPNYHTTKWFSKDLLGTEVKKTKVKMTNSVYLGLSKLEISKTLMYEFWWDYIKPKYQNNAKLCYMDSDSFVIHIKPEDFYEGIANDVKKWFDKSNYSEDDKSPLLNDMSKKVIDLMKD